MLQISLQLAFVVVLLILAISLRVSVHKRRSRGWHEILSNFRCGHAKLAELPEFAEVNKLDHIPIPGKFLGFQRIRVLWRMYSNLDILVEAIDFVENQYAVSQNVERLRKARIDALHAQKSVALLILGKVWAPFALPSAPPIALSLKAYADSITRFSSLLEDFPPDLLRSYRYFVTRESNQS